MEPPLPYLASIGLLAEAPAQATLPDADELVTPLLSHLQSQYGRMVDTVKDVTSRQLERKETELQASEERLGRSLAKGEDARLALEQAHGTEMENHRRATSVALRTLHAELETLKVLHVQELADVRREAEEEHARLRLWCEAQLEAAEANRDAILGEVSERRRESASSGDLQIASLVREHREQQASLRKLLAEEAERSAAAREEVLSLTIVAGNERLALHAELAKARRRAAAAAESSNQGLQAVRDESSERESSMRRALRAAEARLEETVRHHAEALEAAAKKSMDDAALIGQLRKEVANLTSALRAAQAAGAKSDERAASARGEASQMAAHLRMLENSGVETGTEVRSQPRAADRHSRGACASARPVHRQGGRGSQGSARGMRATPRSTPQPSGSSSAAAQALGPTLGPRTAPAVRGFY
jgi:hypothetical protein